MNNICVFSAGFLDSNAPNAEVSALPLEHETQKAQSSLACHNTPDH